MYKVMEEFIRNEGQNISVVSYDNTGVNLSHPFPKHHCANFTINVTFPKHYYANVTFIVKFLLNFFEVKYCLAN